MEITTDEYLALLQTGEGLPTLESKIEEQSQIRYERRYLGIHREGAVNNNTQKKELDNMDKYGFEMRRMTQMMQLYNAYREKSHGRIWIESHDTSMEAVRRVVGPHSGNVFNTGILFLDQQTIETINSIARLSKSDSMYENKNWANNLSASQLYHIVDEVIACQELVANREASINRIVNETGAAKRAIGKQMGRNTFRINDFTITAQDITKRYRGFGKLTNYLKKMMEKTEESLGKEKIDVPELGE